jgi:hypothetical protein
MTQNQWLRDASMARLSIKLRGKKDELIAPLSSIPIDTTALQTSGMGALETGFIEKWVKGSMSGRSCLFHLLNYRMAKSVEKSGKIKTIEIDAATAKARASASKRKGSDADEGEGGYDIPTELAILSSSVNLPFNFMCDSGYLYDSVFCKPPIEVLRYAIVHIRKKALDGDIVDLDADQINLALKQLKVHFVVDDWSVSGDNVKQDSTAENENDDDDDAEGGDDAIINGGNDKGSSNTDKSSKKHLVGEKELHFQVLLELVRLHVREANDATRGGADGADGTHEQQKQKKLQEGKESLDVDRLSTHLEAPIDNVIKSALVTDVKVLEEGNNVLKPYISQLTSFKASLTDQLKHLQDNASFMKLGITKDCSDGAIKKAYHAMAVKCHPDKGGDKQQFQALQDAYQEVLKKKKALDAEKGAEGDADGEEGSAKAAAQTIVDRVQSTMQEVKVAAEECAKLAQMMLHWQKVIEAAARSALTNDFIDEWASNGLSGADSVGSSSGSMGLPKAKGGRRAAKQAMEKLIPLLFGLDSKRGSDAGATTTASEKVDMKSCSVRHAIKPLEQLCESMQACASTAMELPSCGDRYGSVSTAAGSAFVPVVEACMSQGLELLKHVTVLMNVDSQVESTLSRIQTSDEYREVRFGVPRSDIEQKRREKKKKETKKKIEQRISDRLEQRIEERVARRMEIEQQRIQQAVERGVNLSDNEFDSFFEEDMRQTQDEDEEDELFFLQAYEDQLKEENDADMAAMDFESNEYSDDDSFSSASDVSSEQLSDGAYDFDSDSTVDSDIEALNVTLSESDSDDDSIDRLIRRTNRQQKKFEAKQQRRDERKEKKRALKKANKRSKMEILVEMVVTALRSATVSLNMAGERAISAALVSVDLLKSVTEVVQKVEEGIADEAARRAHNREAEEADAGYSDEDKEALNKMRQAAAEEEYNRRKEAADAEREAEDKKRQDEDEEDKRTVEEEGGNPLLQEAKLEKRRTDRELNSLKDKIQKLQVQLRVQHVQALQTMNVEARGLQKQIQRQLNTDHKKSQDRALALVADLVDASLLELRTEAEAFVSTMFTDSPSKERGVERMQKDLSAMVKSHLGWMLALNPGSSRLLLAGEVAATSTSTSSSNDSSHGEEEEKCESESGHEEKASADREGTVTATADIPVLALLPDSRSKALWVASLLDLPRLSELVRREMQKKLTFLDSACMNDLAGGVAAKQQENAGAKCEMGEGDAEGGKETYSSYFCRLVVQGLENTHHMAEEPAQGQAEGADEAK